ncbi:hypothetical protein [Planktothrix agardhii]|uniref:hypothetical protein n=1 Tax=Planktothrix agardhii TaxID=1160 RepID=UPI00042091FE|nr:hypothetical protein [Planktothrix agardhii]CAD0226746.1 conserved hypothetical protein [Planktothrix agardhii]CAD5963544.1 hypothetical protein NO758_03304 [Planktothrix agardhii]
MSQPPALPTLLALLLAIRDHPDVTLNDDKKDELFTIGEQLKPNREMRDETHAKLMSVIQSNDKLNESFTKYQTALIRFLATENSENLDYLPTSEEVLEALQTGNESSQIERRGVKPKKSKRSPSLTIINDIVVPILKSDNPPEVSKKLFQRLLENLQQFSADSDTQPPTLPPLI